jgi:hypothetical protein
VIGQGPAHVEMMLVGEQPGDQEDLAGRPFVGPAGRVLDKALEAAVIERDRVYITNAVKHFKNEPRGKRRPTLWITVHPSHLLRIPDRPRARRNLPASSKTSPVPTPGSRRRCAPEPKRGDKA